MPAPPVLVLPWQGEGMGRGTREEEKGKSENREGEEPERTEIRKIAYTLLHFILHKVLLDKLYHLILPRSLGESKK